MNIPATSSRIPIQKFRNSKGDVHAVLSYQASGNYLLMKWIGYSTDREIVSALEHMQQWQQTSGKIRGCRFHIHDTKEIEGSWAGVIDYICQDFFPQCHQAGLRGNISVISPDFFSKMASLKLLNQKGTVIPTMLANTIREAESLIAERYAVMV